MPGCRSILPASLALLISAAPGVATAGGVELGDTGAEAMARGGTFVAKADNPTAVNYNPAGFAKLRGHHIAISGSAVYSVYDFTRLGKVELPGSGGLRQPFPTMSSSRPWMVVPLHLMITTDLGIFDRVTFAAGIYGPPQTTRAYEGKVNLGGASMAAPQRYNFLNMEGLVMFPTIGVAFRPWHFLDIGLTFQAMMATGKTTSMATVGSACDKPEDPTCDVDIVLDGKDLFSPTGSVGVLARPVPGVEVGAMVRLPTSASLDGTADIKLGPTLKRLQGSMTKPMIAPLDPDVSMSYAYPWMLRAGVRYAFLDDGEEFADVEVDFTWENWSAVGVREINIKAQSLGKPMKPSIVDWHLKDSFAVRVGGAYRVDLGRDWDLTMRLGGFYETEATAVSDTSLYLMGAKRLGLTGGFGVRWRWLKLDMAYGHVWLPTREVNRSTVTAMDFGGGVGPVVGNGTYEASVDMLSVQLTVSLGRGQKAPAPYQPHPAPVYLARQEPAPGPTADPTEELGFVAEPEAPSLDGYSFDPEEVTLEQLDEQRREHRAKRNRRRRARRKAKKKPSRRKQHRTRAVSGGW